MTNWYPLHLLEYHFHPKLQRLVGNTIPYINVFFAPTLVPTAAPTAPELTKPLTQMTRLWSLTLTPPTLYLPLIDVAPVTTKVIRTASVCRQWLTKLLHIYHITSN